MPTPSHHHNLKSRISQELGCVSIRNGAARTKMRNQLDPGVPQGQLPMQLVQKLELLLLKECGLRSNLRVGG